jgi:hypothetical protein
VALSSASVRAQVPSDDVKVVRADPIHIDRTIKDLPPPRERLPERRGEVNRRRTHPSFVAPAVNDSGHRDPVVSGAPPVANAPVTSSNFAGQSFNFVIPPDTVGEAGTTHFVQMVNDPGGSAVGVYNKSTGALEDSFVLSDLAPPSSPCTFAVGDPIPIFDQVGGTNRWLLTEIGNASPNVVCIYVSSAADPTTSTWDLYEFALPEFPDYPKYGVWPNAYFLGYNNGFTNPVVAFDRAAMLAGSSASGVLLDAPRLAGFGFQLLVPVDADGSTAPPSGAPGIFVRHRDDEVHGPSPTNPGRDFVEVWEFSPDFATPSNSTLSGPSSVPVAEFSSDLCGLVKTSCFSQPNARKKLDPLREPIMNRPLWRSTGSNQVLVGSFVTDVNGADLGGVRWFELRRPVASTTGGWTHYQEGTYSPDTDNRWMSSIAVNGVGDIALGYSVSSVVTFPSIRYTGRHDGDTLGLMTQGETNLVTSAGVQLGRGGNRWGDYSAMSVDPSDDTTFWYTNEYIQADGTWATRIASFTFNSSALPIDALCGSAVSGSFVLTHNIYCSGDGLIVSADGTTIDLAGHTISGGSGIGIRNDSGRANLTVRNGTIEGFATGVLSTGAATTASGLMLIANGTGLQTSGDSTRILGNRVSQSAADGIHVASGADVKVKFNTSFDNGQDGIEVEPAAPAASVTSNQGVDYNGAYGIKAPADVGGRRNTAVGNGVDDCDPDRLCA